jgi:hypothetical protein
MVRSKTTWDHLTVFSRSIPQYCIVREIKLLMNPPDEPLPLRGCLLDLLFYGARSVYRLRFLAPESPVVSSIVHGVAPLASLQPAPQTRVLYSSLLVSAGKKELPGTYNSLHVLNQTPCEKDSGLLPCTSMKSIPLQTGLSRRRKRDIPSLQGGSRMLFPERYRYQGHPKPDRRHTHTNRKHTSA